MALDPVPWLVAGGAVHSAEVSRTLAYVAVGGKQGVAEVADCRVTALDIAGSSVRIASGGFAITNTYGSESNQSYIGRNQSDELVAIAPTSGSARSDAIILRIDDPQYGGTTPGDVTVGPYVLAEVVSNVGSATSIEDLGLDYPAILLARIDVPASTGTITNSMIVDLRQVISPHAKRELLINQPSGNNVLTSSTLVEYPSTGWTDIEIPEWATRVKLVGHIGGIKFEAPEGTGWLGIQLGTDGNAVRTEETAFNNQGLSSGWFRPSYVLGGDLEIPAEYRGTVQHIAIVARLNTGTGGARPNADASTTLIIDAEFVEDPAAV